MITLLGLAVAASMGGDFSNVPVEYETVGPADTLVSISDSVRAATWDGLSSKPSEPVQVRLACIVFVASGAPGACVPASLLPVGQKTVDWPAIRNGNDVADRSANWGDVEMRRTSALRIDAARIHPQPVGKGMFVIRVFEEIISPADARPAFVPGEALTMQDVTLAKPLDGSLLQALYPVLAMRYSVTARVTVICKIEESLRILCRDLGKIQSDPSEIGEWTPELMHSLQFSTYQLASTLKFEKKDKNGNDISGRNIKVSIVWKIPE